MIRPRVLKIELMFGLISSNSRGFILLYFISKTFKLEPSLIGLPVDSKLDFA